MEDSFYFLSWSDYLGFYIFHSVLLPMDLAGYIVE